MTAVDTGEPAGTTVPADDAETRDRELAGYVIKSYRYLRLSIVVVLLSLMASVFIERAHTDCWQGSLSSYFYTPVHSMFVGALLVLAVSLIAIRGCTEVEDVALNLAGVLAAIVAFVPTAPSAHECTSSPLAGGDPSASLNNNLLALIIGGAIAFVAAAVGGLLLRHRRPAGTTPAPKGGSSRSTVIGLIVGGALLVGGVVWYWAFRDNFLEHAHGWGAVFMFVIIGIVILLNAVTTQGTPYRIAYSIAVGVMVASIGVALVGKWIDDGWQHQILWLELLEIAALVLFWSAQTVEHWDGGVPTGAERRERTERAEKLVPPSWRPERQPG